MNDSMWKLTDVDDHKKGLTAKQKEVWIRVANTVLAKCGGGPDCEGKAIRQANAVAGRVKEADVEDYWMDEAMFTADQRKALASKGVAMDDGSFPIRNKADLQNAVAAFGRAKDKEAAKAHIVKRARALGAVSMLPESWDVKETPEYLAVDDPKFREALGLALLEHPHFTEEFVVAASLALDDTETVMEGDFIPLLERAIRPDGTIPIKIVKPGWGSSAYYSPEVLEKSGPVGFPKGTKMFWDHPTATEAKERPERSLTTLAAETVSDARYHADGKDGPGLYADAKVFGDWKTKVDELAPHIGVSLRAQGVGEEGEVEGKRGRILQEFVPGHNSVDFVTAPGAGGKVLSMFEAARPTPSGATLWEGRIVPGQNDGNSPVPPITNGTETTTSTIKVGTGTNPGPSSKEEDVELQEAISLKEAAEKERDEAKTEAARLREAAVLREAKDAVIEALDKVEKDLKVTLLEATRKRLIASLSAKPPTTDEGNLDSEKFETAITEAVKSEVTYLSEVTQRGKVRGMGPKTDDGEPEKAVESMADSFQKLGLSESEAKVAASGR